MSLINSGWNKIGTCFIILGEMENVNEVIQPSPYVSDKYQNIQFLIYFLLNLVQKLG